MITPSEIEQKEFKRGFGYKRRDVDEFLSEILEAYTKLYNENIEYKDKLNILNDGLQYYKSIEKTLQKALVLAQKTADDHHADAIKRAKTIEMEARIKADKSLQAVVGDFNKIKAKTVELLNKYEFYKAQYKNLANAQLEILDSDVLQLSVSEINENLLKESIFTEEEKEAEAKEEQIELNEGEMDAQSQEYEEENEDMVEQNEE